MDIHDWVKAHTEFSEFDIYDVVGLIVDYINDGWRDAQKEFPPHEESVLVYVQFSQTISGKPDKPFYAIAQCIIDNGGHRKWSRRMSGLDKKDVIAWRDLPAPPVFPVQKSNLLFMPTVASSQGE